MLQKQANKAVAAFVDHSVDGILQLHLHIGGKICDLAVHAVLYEII